MEAVIDALIILLLLVLLALGGVLLRHLRELQQGSAAIERLTADLLEASERAETALGGLKSGLKGTQERLATEVTQAQGLRDELRLMIGSADQLAERLVNGIEKARDAAPRPAAAETAATDLKPALASAASEAKAPSKASPPPAARRDLERALSVLR